MTVASYYADDAVTLHHGDALQVLREMPAAAVDCCITSPPYFGLRDYGDPRQYGMEATPAEYVERLRVLFAEVWRVVTDDGTLWVNLGDCYAGKANGGPTRDRHRGHGHRAGIVTKQRNLLAHAPYKSMLGLPWRLAFALIDDGWALRNDIIWHKPNATPESVIDRLRSSHEHVFLLTKSPQYWFDLDAVKVRTEGRASGNLHEYAGSASRPRPDQRFGGNPGSTLHSGAPDSRNPGDVWTIPTRGFPEAHFATMPPALAERCVQAGCKPGGVVLDPFSGAGTTGLAATRHGRRYVGIDLKSEYLDLSLRTRLAQSAFVEGGESA